jgi:hypothetical protein
MLGHLEAMDVPGNLRDEVSRVESDSLSVLGRGDSFRCLTD